ncbi:MAG: PASTA domain-containing protein [Gilvibacter sp.]
MSFLRFLLTKAFLKQLGLAVLAILAFSMLVLLYLRLSTNHSQRIEVPDLSKLSLEEVDVKLSDIDLKWQLLDSTNYNPEYPKRSVIEQLPAAGSFVKEDRKIYLTLNRSNYPKLKVPNVVGRTKRQAEPTLLSLGFKIGKITYIPYIAKDEVMQIKHNGKVIEPGTQLEKTSVIDLVLGDGKGSLRAGSGDSDDDDSDGAE